jgi:hypothetical protein
MNRQDAKNAKFSFIYFLSDLGVLAVKSWRLLILSPPKFAARTVYCVRWPGHNQKR